MRARPIVLSSSLALALLAACADQQSTCREVNAGSEWGLTFSNNKGNECPNLGAMTARLPDPGALDCAPGAVCLRNVPPRCRATTTATGAKCPRLACDSGVGRPILRRIGGTTGAPKHTWL
jgi:hypothetical protein